jgi:hypothetical protein
MGGVHRHVRWNGVCFAGSCVLRRDLLLGLVKKRKKGYTLIMQLEHPKPSWFRFLEQWFPERCREVPEASDPDRILLRQFAIVKGCAYLQQFASGENPEFYHSHPWRHGTIAIGLRGRLIDHNFVGYWRHKEVRAPYFRYMGPNTVHNTTDPSPDHVSIFIGLGTKTNDKGYWVNPPKPQHWTNHIQRLVKRL